MKKFQFAAGFAALAMLASCSSDAPEGPNVEPVNGGMFLSIKVTGDKTRAAERDAETEEDAIDHLQIYILDKDGKLYFSKIIQNSEIEDGVATFPVTLNTFNEMKGRANENWEVLVYANGTSLSTTSFSNLLIGATDKQPWGPIQSYTANSAGNGYNEKGFIMSNAKRCVGPLKAIGTSDGSEENPWLIKAEVELSRLATRFDWSTSNATSYTALTDKDLTITIKGFDVETFASNTYRIAQFSEDGKEPSDKTKMAQFEPTDDAPYRVTDVIDNDPDDDEFETYLDYSYHLTSGKHLYRRPNTISTAATPTFGNTPFAVVKASFTSTKVTKSATNQEEVYALNGFLIGGVRELADMKGKTFTIAVPEGTTLTDDEKTLKEEVEKNVQRFLDSYTFSKDESGNLKIADNQANVKRNLSPEVYAFDKTDNCYYTYYAAMIIHDDSEDAHNSWKYGVSRNTVYDLGVQSIRMLGNNGAGHPGEGPKATDLADLNMMLSVKPLKWGLNTANSGMKL